MLSLFLQDVEWQSLYFHYVFHQIASIFFYLHWRLLTRRFRLYLFLLQLYFFKVDSYPTDYATFRRIDHRKKLLNLFLWVVVAIHIFIVLLLSLTIKVFEQDLDRLSSVNNLTNATTLLIFLETILKIIMVDCTLLYLLNLANILRVLTA